MRFAICNETFGDWTVEKGFELAVDCGYRGIEVAPFTLGPRAELISPIARSRYRALAASFGLEIVGLHWLLAKTSGFHLTTEDQNIRRQTATYLGLLAQLCADIGGKLMVLGSPLQRNFPPEMTHEQASENAISVMELVLPTLEKLGVQIAIEPLGPAEGNFLNQASQAVRIIKRLDSPLVKLHLDVKAMSSESIPIDSIIRENAQWLIHFHANDPNKLGPGMGDVDQVPIFKALKDIHYDGWVSVEVFDYALGAETILRTSMQNMLSAIRSADSQS